MYVNNKKIETVDEFKYLGIMLSKKATKPDKILKARLNAAKRSFYSICTNCRIVGITNVKVKLLLVNALVRSVLLYGCILYACMSDVQTTLTPTNGLFAQVEIFYRRMLRWIFQQKYDTRRSMLYFISN
jgi:hypothetical protein